MRIISFTAVPSFIEAPLDVEINEGNTVLLPCRAQGRPKARIVWDRLGAYVAQPSIETEETSQFLEEESQEVMLAKAKIMSLRTKRQPNETTDIADDPTAPISRSKRQTIIERTFGNVLQIPDLYVHNELNRDKRDQAMDLVVSEFRQIMRDVNQASFDTNFRRKRDITVGDDEESNDDDDETDEAETEELMEPTPILFFSTPSPIDSQTLVTNENGELVLRDVTARDQGWYACAGLNEAGSTVKRVFVRVLGSSANPSEFIPQTSEPLSTSQWSAEQNIIITSIVSSSANAVDVTWETSDGVPSTTLTLHFRPVGEHSFQTASALIDARRFAIGDLKAHTEYEVFATVPHGLSGSVSNIRRGKTMDGPPSAPPTDVRVGVINITAAYVRWSPPPTDMLNGDLTGYKVTHIHSYMYTFSSTHS